MELDIKETGPMPVNTYILKDDISKEAIIIDVGGDFENIKKEIESQGCLIKYILNTHGHFDHILGEIYVREKYPEIPIYMHKDDLSHIKNLNNEMMFFGMNSANKSNKLADNPPEFIDEDSELFIGNKKINIFYTPGHSKGSLSFYIDGILFSGDVLFFHSIGRTDFYDGDFNTLIDSIKSKLLILPDDTKVYPGHGISTTIGEEKQFYKLRE